MRDGGDGVNGWCAFGGCGAGGATVLRKVRAAVQGACN